MSPARRRTRSKDRRSGVPGPAPHRAPEPATPSGQGFGIPLGLTLALLSISLVPRVQAHPVLAQSFWGAAAGLLAWQAALFLWLRRQSAAPAIDTVLRPQHYVQAAVQLSVFAYWGWYWRPVYDHAWLLAGQLVFAYAFDLLLAWSRRERYTLGCGPFPIIFSTNLFLWFRDDWFYLQFLMIAVGFLGKAFVRWERGGRRVHIFNPSAFSLGLFSVVLIATGTTALTWGEDIATTLTLAPRIYLFLFLAGLVVMYRFAITLVAGSAAIVLFGLSALYAAATGDPLVHRFRDPDRGLSRPAPAGDRSVHLAPDANREDRLRRAVRRGRLRPVRAARRVRDAHVLRQAAVGAASQPERALDRPARRRAGGERTARTRRRAPGPPPCESRADGGLDRLLRRDDADRRDRRATPGRHRAVLGAGVRGGTARKRASGYCRSRRRTARTRRPGPATSWGSTTPTARSSPRTRRWGSTTSPGRASCASGRPASTCWRRTALTGRRRRRSTCDFCCGRGDET